MQQGDARKGCGVGGVGRDLRGERVCRVHDGVDRVVGQPVSETLDASETADPNRADRQPRVGNPTGERGHDVESPLVGTDPSQLAGFARAAEDQDFQGCPLK
ncbi:hypothetical protein GCM10011591_06110 [Nocardia camponoti]|uniref:Uncharacterized protein n=1 Tax=Nocardia camponoti TaxID=1616106 RepID=A0A917Q993_9NOCA|nr:hypothetical protein GCM10011591_06110 [Nocardia camponoti]